jgi:hypothetical protein
VRFVVRVALLSSTTGCDATFGLTDAVDPCETNPGAFDRAAVVDVGEADDFSIAGSLGVVQVGGVIREVHLEDGAIAGEALPIPIGDFAALGFGFAPEGDALFYTAPFEPFTLMGAVRTSDGMWLTGRAVPKATYAGTPSADAYGPRRVFVRMRHGDTVVEELEDVNGVWTPIGESREVTGVAAPNLVPSGLTMVWSGVDPATPEVAGEVVFAASRATASEPFGAPRVILSRPVRAPQLIGDRCQTLYASENGRLVRMDR